MVDEPDSDAVGNGAAGDDDIDSREDLEVRIDAMLEKNLSTALPSLEKYCTEENLRVLTVLIGDQVGSSRIASEHTNPEGKSLRDQFRGIYEKICKDHKGIHVEYAGDEFLAVFSSPSNAVRCALALQAKYRDDSPFEVRIGLHDGEIVAVEEEGTHSQAKIMKEVFGREVNICARICGMSSAERILISRSVFDKARANIPSKPKDESPELTWANWGGFYFDGVERDGEPEAYEVCEVYETKHGPREAPGDSQKSWAKGHEDDIFGWRPGPEAVLPGTNWRLERKLGEGGFGEVWLARDKAGRKTVFKFCTKKKKLHSLRREYEVFNALVEEGKSPPGITQVIGAHDDRDGDKPPYYIQLEYCAGGDLRQWLAGPGKDVPRRIQLDVAVQAVRAVERIHAKDCIHRDIKPSNFLLESHTDPTRAPVLKICDFGIGQAVLEAAIQHGDNSQDMHGGGGKFALSTNELMQGAGTFLFIAPELVVRRESTPGKVSKQAEASADIYSLGVTLYQVFTGDPEAIPGPGLSGISDDPILTEDIAACLDSDPTKRPTATDLARRLERYTSRRRARRVVRAAFAIALLALIAVGAFLLWDHYRVKSVYFADYVERWHIPEGLYPLSSAQLAGRDYHYRFEYSRNLLRRVVQANSSGSPVSRERHAEQRPTIMNFYYDGEGNLTRRDVVDRNDRVLVQERITSTSDEHYFVDFQDEGGGARALAAITTAPHGGRIFDAMESPRRSTISRYRIVPCPDGTPREVYYLSGTWNTPVSDADGIFGRRFERDALGRITQELYLDLDGRRGANRKGIAGRRFEYDASGNLISIEWVNTENEPWPNEWGYTREERISDARGNTVSAAHFGVDGEPVFDTDGCHKRSMVYDPRGNEIEVACFGLDSESVLNADGYHKIAVEYDKRGNVKSKAYFGLDGKSVLDSYRVHKITIEYDGRGNLVEAASFGLAGEPVLHADGYHKIAVEYDGRGNLVVAAFFGVDGEPVLSTDGIHKLNLDYDGRGNLVEVAFYGDDGEPVLSTDGTHKLNLEYDGRGNLVVAAFFGVDGEPVLNGFGVHKVATRYDVRGNLVEEACFGVVGEPVLNADGFYKLTGEYDGRGNLVKEAHFGEDGEPVLHTNNYHKSKSEYDSRGNMIERSYFGVNGEPVLHSLWYHKRSLDYDERGNVVEEIHFGVDGEPALHALGYHKCALKYNARGNIVEEAFFGVDGEPVILFEGYCKVIYEYDARGNEIVKSFFGLDGEPVLDNYGKHSWVREYEARGNEIEAAYFGLDGEPVSDTVEYHKRTMVHDPRANEIERAHFGVDDEPVLLSSGFHKVASEYDARGNLVRESYFGVDGEPVLHALGYPKFPIEFDVHGNLTEGIHFGVNGESALYADGYHTVTREYDARGKALEEAYFGVDGKPVLLSLGYHKITFGYDAIGNVVEDAHFGVGGEPVANAHSYHKCVREYDARGNLVRELHLGVDGEPVHHTLGYHKRALEFDARGNNIEESFFGVDDEPVAHVNSYHKRTREYDVRGYVVEDAFFGVDGKPTLRALGFHRITFRYDAIGNVVEEAYFGLDDEPAVHIDNYHKSTREYDARRYVIERAYFGVNGEPVLLSLGYHKVTLEYDAHGIIVEEVFFGVDGEPVAHPNGFQEFTREYDAHGNARFAEGDIEGALEAYEAGLEIVERLASQDSTNSEWQHDLAVRWGNIGNVRLAQGDADGALEAYEASLEIRKRLVSQDPTNAQSQRALSISWDRIGDARQAHVARRTPHPLHRLRWSPLADVRHARGDAEGALEAYEAALEIRERLVSQDPTNEEWQRDLSISWLNVGLAYQNQGNTGEARVARGKSVERFRELARRLPDSSQARIDYRVVGIDFAWFLLTAFDDSEPDVALALEIAEEVAKLTEGQDSNVLNTLARAQYLSGDTAAAVVTQRRVLDQAPENDADRHSYEARLVEYEAALAEE